MAGGTTMKTGLSTVVVEKNMATVAGSTLTAGTGQCTVSGTV